MPATLRTVSPVQSTYQISFRLVRGVRTMRGLVALGVLALAQFLWWFATPAHVGYAPLFWLLCISLGFKLLRVLHEWAHYVQVREPVPPAYPPRRRQVDVLTTACPGEPLDMIVRTLTAMQAITYPHTSYLCDEGNDPVLRAACRRLGVVHVTRQVKVNAKAGNINNALRQATGEFCVVLDPDHVPTPDFLDQVMPYFEDEGVGYVQVVQAYGNQADSLVAQGAAEQTYHFYGPLMMGMNGYGTAMAIGANCTFRRAALDSIGGHATGLTEDMHTAMRLHAAGWQSVYAPVVVSKGLVPATLGAFYGQQLKWSRGAFELLFFVYPRLFRHFTWAQRLHYLVLPLYFLAGAMAMLDLAVPVGALVLVEFPWHVSLRALAIHALPIVASSLLIRGYAQRWLRKPHERGLHLAGGFLRVGTWWVYTLGLVYTLLRVRVPYLPTPKQAAGPRNEWLLALPNLATALLLLAACKYGRVQSLNPYCHLMVGLTLVNVGILLAAAFMGQHQVARNFAADMAARPFQSLVRALAAGRAALASIATRLLRRAAPQLALGLAGLAVSAQLWLPDQPAARQPDDWARTGGTTVHTGRLLPTNLPFWYSGYAGLAAQPALAGGSADAATASDILAVNLPDGPIPLLPLPLLQALSTRQVPLLSWSAAPAGELSPAYWRRVARQFQQLPGRRAVLLRPLLPVSSPAAYRRSWADMVAAFKVEKIRNVVWVWTPPQSESLAAYLPAALDWLALEGPPGDAALAAAYAPVRQQVAATLELHSKPLLLLTSLPPSATPNAAAAQLAATYPELKAVVYYSAAPLAESRQWTTTPARRNPASALAF